MTKFLTEDAEVSALPDRSVVVLTNLPDLDDATSWTETAIYQKVGRDWIEMDPGDRYDGEHTWRDSDILIIAKREKYNAYVAFNPSDFGKATDGS